MLSNMVADAAANISTVITNVMFSNIDNGGLIALSDSAAEDIKNSLNDIFGPQNRCTSVIYTNNTDKVFFGIKVSPNLSDTDALKIILGDETDHAAECSYAVEFDSKLFNCGLTEEEITCTLLFEISNMLSETAVNRVKAIIDLKALAKDEVITIRNSVNYTQLFAYGIKDTLYKVSSIIFTDDIEDIAANPIVQALNCQDTILSAQQKIMSSVYGMGDAVRAPKVAILDWVFLIYNDIAHYSTMAKENLKEAKDFTGSKLEKLDIDKTIQAIDNLRGQIMFETSLTKTFDNNGLGSLNEISLFKSLKQKGLRSVEDTLYELSIRIKNCSTEEDAMYILRMINSRLSILDDYLYNTPELSDSERKHWQEIANQYRELRAALAKKKIWDKKRYGIFVDYDAIDQMYGGNNQDEDY